MQRSCGLQVLFSTPFSKTGRLANREVQTPGEKSAATATSGGGSGSNMAGQTHSQTRSQQSIATYFRYDLTTCKLNSQLGT